MLQFLSSLFKPTAGETGAPDKALIEAATERAIDEVRSAEARCMIQDGYEPVLKKSRWCLLKHRANLTDTQSHYEKSLRLQDIPSNRNLTLSCAWETTRAKTSPQFLLTIHI